MRRRVDVVAGARFGPKTVLSELKAARGVRWFRVRCECGYAYALKLGSVVKSGKCIKCRSLKDDVVVIVNKYYDMYRRAAKARLYAWELSKQHFTDLVMQPCYYCGVSPTPRTLKGKPRGAINGIDRVKPALGYTKSNQLVACCSRCNDMKGTLELADFLRQIVAIATHQGLLKD